MQYDIMVECFQIAITKDFVRAFATLMTVIYVFNVEYPKNLVGTLIFAQKFLLKISDKQKTPGQVLKPISPLKNITMCSVYYTNYKQYCKF